MSLKALVWSLEEVEVFCPSQKFCLVALANYCSDTGKSYPAVATICKLTQLSDNTVRRCLKQLEDSGWIKDTGKRYGPTQQVKVWQLPDEAWKLNDKLKVRVEDPRSGGLTSTQDPRKTPGRPPEDPRSGGRTREPVNRETKGASASPAKSNGNNVVSSNGKPTDEEWLASLKASPAYKGIDVGREFEKAKIWIAAHPTRKLSRRFFTNWLGRIEPEVKFTTKLKAENLMPGWGGRVNRAGIDIVTGERKFMP